MTEKIQIKQHLAEYCIGKWGSEMKNPVQFSDKTELYFKIHDLTQKRPINAGISTGNLEIVIPNRSKSDGDAIRKNPEVYNYLSRESAMSIQKRIESMMYAELHELLDTNKHMYGIEYAETVHEFKCKYHVESLTDDALLKDYYRWRLKKRRREKRGYRRKISK